MNLDLHVSMDIFANPACRLSDYVLPAACGFEKPIIHGGDYYPYLHGGEAAIDPLFERKPEYYFWRELGIRLGQEEYWPWQTLEDAYDWRIEPLGMTFKQFIAGKAHDTHPLPEKKYEANGFGTPTGKYEIYSTILEKLGCDPLPSFIESSQLQSDEYPLTLVSGTRNRNFYHSQGRQMEYLRKRSPEPVAQLNPKTAKNMGITKGDWMWIETKLGRARFKCQYSNEMDTRIVTGEHGWWFPEDDSIESLFVSNINALVDDNPDICDPASGNYVFRGQPCKVYKTEILQ